MGVAYGQDLRDRVLAAYDRGMKTKQIAELVEVSSSWARRVKQRRRETGETAPRPRGGATIIKIDLDRLGALVKRRPDATMKRTSWPARRRLRGVGGGYGPQSPGVVFQKNDPCSGTRPPGRSPTPGRMESNPAENQRQTFGFHRRNLEQDEHDTSAWPVAARAASDRQNTARPLEDHDPDRRAGHRWDALFDRRGRRRQRGRVRGIRRTGSRSRTSVRRCGERARTPAETLFRGVDMFSIVRCVPS